MPFDGLRVLSLESRRAEEMATLIRKQGGEPFVAPSMREVPLEQREEASSSRDRLLRGEFDCVILLTGVGTRLLWKTLLTRYPEDDLKSALQRVTVIVRGPNPPPPARTRPYPQCPGPGTEHLARTARRLCADRPENRLALQEYGKSNQDLLDGLLSLGKQKSPRCASTVGIFPKTPAPCARLPRN